MSFMAEVRHERPRRLLRGARARREHRRRRAPDARDLRRRLALRGRHLGPARPPADRLAVRPRRDRGAAVRADPARARRAQPLARAVLPAVERHADRAHAPWSWRPTAASTSPLALLFFVPVIFAALSYPLASVVAIGALDYVAYVAVGVAGRRGRTPSTSGFFALCLGVHRRAVRLARPQPGPPPRGARARVARGPADRLPQPPRLRGALRRRAAAARCASGRPVRADHARPRPLQGGQRHARPRAPATSCCAGPSR